MILTSVISTLLLSLSSELSFFISVIVFYSPIISIWFLYNIYFFTGVLLFAFSLKRFCNYWLKNFTKTALKIFIKMFQHPIHLDIDVVFSYLSSDFLDFDMTSDFLIYLDTLDITLRDP